MTQHLGQVERPTADQYQGKRKLLLVPLLYAPQAEDGDGAVIVNRYWEQVQAQTGALESSLGGLHRIYCESLVEGGEEGIKYLEGADSHSAGLVRDKAGRGAVLEPTEDPEVLFEIIDLQRILMGPMVSQRVASRIQEWFTEANRSRYEAIGQRIDSTLQADETGLLLIGERHQVQFPNDIEVFYVAPPALDEFRRWLQAWMARQQAEMASQNPGEPVGDGGDTAEGSGEPAAAE